MYLKLRLACFLTFFLSSTAMADASYNLWSDPGGFPCASQSASAIPGIDFTESFPGSLYQSYSISIDLDGDGSPEVTGVANPLPAAPTIVQNVSFCSDHQYYPFGYVKAYSYVATFSNGATVPFVSAYCYGIGHNQGRRLIALGSEVYCLKQEVSAP